MVKNSYKRLSLWLFDQGLDSFCVASLVLSLYSVPHVILAPASLLPLSLLGAGPSFLFVEKSPCLHLELLKGHCKYWVFMNSLFPFKMLSKMPAARDFELILRATLSSRTHGFALICFLSCEEKRVLLLSIRYEESSWVKTSSLFGKKSISV